jgi:hypothetical protein
MMKTYRVTLTYDRRSHACPVFEVDVQADLAIEARGIARRHALKFWTTDCPLTVVAVEIAPKMTAARMAQDEAELMRVMGAAA